MMGAATAADDNLANETVSTSNYDVDALNTDSVSVDEKVSTAETTVLVAKDTGNKEILSSNNDSELLSTTTKSYNELNKTINNGNNYIKLDSDYKYTESDNLKIINVITPNITIDGDGHIIDGNNLARGFMVSAKNVTFKNINFINCYQAGTQASAITFLDDAKYGKVLSCNFTNCLQTVNNDGGTVKFGTVYVRNIDMFGVVDNCIFENNVARDGGGICVGENYVNITNTIFKNNQAKDDEAGVCLGRGAAVYLLGSYNKFENCTFINNTQKALISAHGGGGAVCYYRGLNNTFYNCEFFNNTATRGGAVYYNNAQPSNTKYGLFYNCTFIGNKAHGEVQSSSTANISGCGGALFIVCSENNIINCTFKNNFANESGGAVYINNNNNNITNCTFINNTANLMGGAIYANAQGCQITTSEFINNTAQFGKDSYASPSGSIKYNGLSFDEFYIKNDDNQRTSVGNGNGMSFDNPIEWSNNLYTYFRSNSQITLYILGSLTNFTTKTLNNGYSNVIIKGYNSTSGFKDLNHTVFNVKTDHVTIDALTFNNITDNVILINDDGTNIKNCIFTDNNATGNGSCILVESSGDNLIIDNCTFNGNNATNGGAIYIKNTTNSSQVLNCKFNNNHAKMYGGAIYIDDNMYYYIFEPTYNGNKADIKDDDASVDRALEMKHVIYASFMGNGSKNGDSAENAMSIYLAFTAVAPNGKIIFGQKGDIINYNMAVVRELGKSNITFVGNDTTFVNVQFYANTYAKNTKLYNASFVNYTQTAIKVESSDNIIRDCKFINCTDTCIIVTGTGSKADNCTFENNTVEGNASCILISANSISIENSTFKANNASEYGGAIYISAGVKDINLVNSKFNGNNATNDGAAIYNNGVLTVKDDSVFTDNKADNNGGAIYNNATLTIKDSSFSGNNAQNGGAIYNNATLTIKDSVFTSNEAVNGGAVYANHTLTVYDSKFADNQATQMGGAIFANSTIELSNTNFTDNVATTAGAIYLLNNSKVTRCNLTNNTALTSNGGAIYIKGNNNVISDSVFSLNRATHGSAISVKNLNNNISYCNFTNNNATSYDGAVHVEGNKTYIDHCLFENNYAVRNGAAIRFDKCTVIDNCTFINNTAKNNGGAISYQNNEVYSMIINSIFKNNHANYGGAIYCYNNGLTVKNSNFTNNNATNNGGAIYSKTCNVSGSVFTGNNATNGGAIFITDDSVVVGCNFTNNFASRFGGALYVNGRIGLSLTDSNFNSNYAINGSAIYLSNTVSGFVVKDCDFIENVASGNGTVYLIGATGCDFENNVFIDNMPVGVDNNYYLLDKDEPVYISNVVYVSNGGGGTGLTADDPTTWSSANKIVKNHGVIILTSDIIIENMTFTNKNVTLVGNSFNIKRQNNDNKYLFS